MPTNPNILIAISSAYLNPQYSSEQDLIDFTRKSGWNPLMIANIREYFSDVSVMNLFDMPPQCEEKAEQLLEKENVIPVFLDKETKVRFLETSNADIWPVLHQDGKNKIYEANFSKNLLTSQENFSAYQIANQQFMKKIEEYIEKCRSKGQTDGNIIIWIHDYQLALVPKLIKDKFPRVQVGYFHHTPWPALQDFNKLPYWEELIAGISHADHIGFQTDKDKKNFLEAKKNTYLNDSQAISDKLKTIPIGADYEYYSRDITNPIGNYMMLDLHLGLTNENDPDSKKKKTAMQKIHEVEKFLQPQPHEIIISMICRADPSKAPLETIEAILKYKRENPKMPIKFALVLLETRPDIEEYRELAVNINRKVEEINQEFEGLIVFPHEKAVANGLTNEQIMALNRFTDIKIDLATTFDGFNLSSSEYIASQKYNSAGVSIISKGLGANAVLGEHCLVSDSVEVEILVSLIEKAIDQQLNDRENSIKNMHALREKIENNRLTDWIFNNLRPLFSNNLLFNNSEQRYQFRKQYACSSLQELLMRGFFPPACKNKNDEPTIPEPTPLQKRLLQGFI